MSLSGIHTCRFFTDPKMFFTQILEQIKLGPLTNFERFQYSRTFLKRIVKVRNRINKFLPPVGVDFAFSQIFSKMF